MAGRVVVFNVKIPLAIKLKKKLRCEKLCEIDNSKFSIVINAKHYDIGNMINYVKSTLKGE